jgi:hypothetical protein
MKRSICAGAMVVAGMLGWGSAANADPLTLSGGPDLASFKLAVTYTFTSNPINGTLGTGHLNVDYTGAASTWSLWPSLDNHAGSPLNTYSSGDVFHLDADFTVVNATTLVVTGGNLNVVAGGTALFTSSNLLAFGYSVQSGGVGLAEWQFEFAKGGGTYGVQGPIGVDLHGGVYTGYKTGGIGSYNWDVINFTQDFDNTSRSNGGADTFVIVPLPKVAWMFLTLPALLLIQRRRNLTLPI